MGFSSEGWYFSSLSTLLAGILQRMVGLNTVMSKGSIDYVLVSFECVFSRLSACRIRCFVYSGPLGQLVRIS